MEPLPSLEMETPKTRKMKSSSSWSMEKLPSLEREASQAPKLKRSASLERQASQPRKTKSSASWKMEPSPSLGTEALQPQKMGPSSLSWKIGIEDGDHEPSSSKMGDKEAPSSDVEESHPWKMESVSPWKSKIQDEVKKAYETTKEFSKQSGSIHPLPQYVAETKPEAYKPQTVSFGPYHYSDQNLRATEEFKDHAVFYFLKRSNTQASLDEYFNVLREVGDDLKGAYPQLDSSWKKNTEDFLQLMIRDGCFMVEVLRIASSSKAKLKDYAPDDPLLRIPSTCVLHDAFLLGNQLPYEVLRRLVGVQMGKDYKNKDDDSIDKVIWEEIKISSSPQTLEGKVSKCYHLLHVWQKNLVGETPPPEAHTLSERNKHSPLLDSLLEEGSSLLEEGSIDKITWSVRDMHDSGIKMVKCERLGGLSFKDGTLTLPLFPVDCLTETFFLNVKAMEVLQPGVGQHVTSYLKFMGTIIVDAYDVAYLRSVGVVLKDPIISDEETVELLKLLSKDIMLATDNHVLLIYREIHNYCHRGWFTRVRAKIKRKYFRHPWAGICAIFGFVMFVINFAQTIFSVYPFYKKIR